MSNNEETDEPLSEQESEILEGLKDLRTTTVREVMTPRVDVEALRSPVSADDVLRAVKESGHSRFPVYSDDIDHLVGVLFVKDLFRAGLWSQDADVEAIERRLREPYLVPETRNVLELLTEMRTRRVAFAVVVDEHGGVEGVLTIKDLVSELVGDLPDEFDDSDDDEIARVDAQRWLVDGATAVDDVTEETGLPIPDGEYVTLGGFLFERFGRIPDEGETMVWQGFELKIEEMDRRRIAKVVVRAPSATLDESGSAQTGSDHGM